MHVRYATAPCTTSILITCTGAEAGPFMGGDNGEEGVRVGSSGRVSRRVTASNLAAALACDAGRLTLLESIGQGGLGTVYKVRFLRFMFATFGCVVRLSEVWRCCGAGRHAVAEVIYVYKVRACACLWALWACGLVLR